MRILFTFILAIASSVTFCQQIIGEIEVAGSIEDLDTFAAGDSIFVSYYERVQSQKKKQRTFWVLPDGKIQSLEIPELRDKLLCGINRAGTRFYYYEVEKKAAVVKCLAYDRVSGERRILPGQIEIPGRILGSYFEKDLNLIWVTRENFKFEMVTIRDLQVIQTRTFPLAADLANGRQTLSFIMDEKNVRPESAASDIKIIKRPDEIFVISDEHNRAGDHDGKTNRTMVSRIDLITDKITSRTYSSPFKKSFTTTMFDGYVIRSVPSEGLEVYHFETNKLVNKLSFDKKYSGITSYERDGTKKMTKLNVSKKYEIAGNFIAADPGEGEDVILTIGSYWMNKPPMIAASPIPLMALAMAVSTGVGRALTDGTLMVNYTYLKGPIKSELQPTNEVPLIRKAVDDYEIQQHAAGNKFKFKAYSVIGDFTYAFYRYSDKDSLQVMKFAPK